MSRAPSLIALVSLGLLALTACDPSRSEVCAQQLPRLIDDADKAVLALVPWRHDLNERGEKVGRAIASVGAPVGASSDLPRAEKLALSEADRKAWMHWAEARLTLAQKFTDLTRIEPSLHRHHSEASRLATEIVAFHGFAQRGDADRMSASLDRIKSAAQTVTASVCVAR